MIADTAVSSSLWSGESVCLKDYGPSDLWHNTALDSRELEIGFLAEFERLKRNQNCHIQYDCNLSTGTSVASSECSDEQDLYLDVENDGEIEESLFADITSSLLGLIGENDVSDSEQMDNLDLIPLLAESSTMTIDNLNNNTVCSSKQTDDDNTKCSCNTPVKSQKQKSSHLRIRRHSNCLDSRNWCELTEPDKISLIEDLSSIISGELGLREQLEVIRIINPTAQISPTDKEFIIELDSLNDEKLQKIQEYIRLHAKSSCTPEDVIESNPVSQKKLHKKQKTPEKRNQHKVHRQRQRKEYRQALKEKRSGLFAREEVLSLSVCQTPEEEDIDILG